MGKACGLTIWHTFKNDFLTNGSHEALPRADSFGDRDKRICYKHVSAALPALLPVRHPDILHLHRVVEEPAAFSLFLVKPINRATFVRENLFKISDR